MLSESIAIAVSITSGPVYAPGTDAESASANRLITDLCACWEWVVLRRCTAKDTSERWYHGGRQRQGQGGGYQTSLRRGSLSTCLLLRPLLVLLGQ